VNLQLLPALESSGMQHMVVW